jgi:hypothetical protein
VIATDDSDGDAPTDEDLSDRASQAGSASFSGRPVTEGYSGERWVPVGVQRVGTHERTRRRPVGDHLVGAGPPLREHATSRS